MGCLSFIGRIVLVVLNIGFVLGSLAVVVVGALLKFLPDKLTEIIFGVSSIIVKDEDRTAFHIPDLKDVTNLPFVGDAGVALMVFGGVLFCISFMACCGASGKWKLLLLGFIICMSILVICQGVVGGMFLAKDSVLHDNIRSRVGDKVKSDFNKSASDPFSFSINLMNYLLDCCGIRGQEDFNGTLPPTCCRKDIIEGTNNTAKQACTAEPPYATKDMYNDEGCYDMLQKKVQDNLVIAAVILAHLLLLQVIEIGFAGMLVKSDNSIGPV